MSTIDINDDNFSEMVLDSKGLVLVDFWADWCGPCKMLAPTLEEIGEEMASDVKVVKLDTEANQKTAAQFRIMSLPTVVLFKDGEPVDAFIGVQPKSVFEESINKHK